MLVVEPDAAVRRPAADLSRVVRAMDPVVGPRQVERPRAERVVRAWRHVVGPFGIALLHRRRRPPVGFGVLEGDSAHPLMTAGAGILSSIAKADGFVIIPENVEGCEEESEVDVVLIE